jgi:hypothetical protein
MVCRVVGWNAPNTAALVWCSYVTLGWILLRCGPLDLKRLFGGLHFLAQGDSHAMALALEHQICKRQSCCFYRYKKALCCHKERLLPY